MDTLEALQKAIEEQKTITFEYDKDGKVKGERVGDPHAIFSHKTKDTLTVDIYQTAGVSDTKEEVPGWRPFLVEHIKNVVITNDKFVIAKGYESNPTSGRYDKVFCKVR